MVQVQRNPMALMSMENPDPHSTLLVLRGSLSCASHPRAERAPLTVTWHLISHHTICFLSPVASPGPWLQKVLRQLLAQSLGVRKQELCGSGPQPSLRCWPAPAGSGEGVRHPCEAAVIPRCSLAALGKDENK